MNKQEKLKIDRLRKMIVGMRMKRSPYNDIGGESYNEGVDRFNAKITELRDFIDTF